MVAASVGRAARFHRDPREARLLDSGLNERTTPALVLDQALSLLRRARPAQWLRAIAAGLPLSAVLLSLYALEHVIGVRPPLAVFAVLCALAYWARFRGVAALARELVATLAPNEPLAGVGTFKTAMAAGIGSWFWAICLLAAAQSSFVTLLMCLPLLCVRGALAPSLLARAACAPDTGLQALARATADTRGLRQLFASVELLALLALLALFGNLYAAAALALLFASSVLGLDVGFVSALIAPDNELVPLLLLGVAALALEPLRAAISALAFQNARERWEGADIGAELDTLSRTRTKPQRSAAPAVLLPLLAALAAQPVHAHAQPEPDAASSDSRARAHARKILARGEFLPSASDAHEASFREWLDRRLRERGEADRDASAPPRFELSVPPSYLIAASLVLLLAVGVWFWRSQRSAGGPIAAAVGGKAPEPSSAEHVAEATRLAQQAEYAASVRRLYAACLRALGHFAAHQTNGQVLRRLGSLPLQAAFASLTEVFERSRYGRQELTHADYERSRALAEQILHATQPASEAK
jgi:hypothetical protein